MTMNLLLIRLRSFVFGPKERLKPCLKPTTATDPFRPVWDSNHAVSPHSPTRPNKGFREFVRTLFSTDFEAPPPADWFAEPRVQPIASDSDKHQPESRPGARGRFWKNRWNWKPE